MSIFSAKTMPFALRKDLEKKYETVSHTEMCEILYSRVLTLLELSYHKLYGFQSDVPLEDTRSMELYSDYCTGKMRYYKVLRWFIHLPKFVQRWLIFIPNVFYNMCVKHMSALFLHLENSGEKDVYNELCTLEYIVWQKRVLGTGYKVC